MRNKVILATGAMLALAACGGSNGDPQTRVLTGLNAFNIGTTSSTETASGLPFAEDLDEEDLIVDGAEIKVRLVRFVTDYATGESSIVVTEETLRFPSGEGASDGTLTYAGQNIQIVADGEGDTIAILSNGQELGSFINQEGDFVISTSLYTYDNDQESGFDSEGSFLVGAETNPAFIAALADSPFGRTSYSGDVAGYGNVVSGDEVLEQEVELTGDILIFVDFSDGNIGGEIELSFGGEGVDVVLEIDETTLSGNGFATTASCDEGCDTSDTQLGGAFFGPNAEEIGGLIGVDVTQEDDSMDVRFIGAGSFIAGEDDHGGCC